MWNDYSPSTNWSDINAETRSDILNMESVVFLARAVAGNLVSFASQEFS